MTWVWVAIAGAGVIGLIVGVILVAWCLSWQQNAMAEENVRLARELRRARRNPPPSGIPSPTAGGGNGHYSERDLREARLWLQDN